MRRFSPVGALWLLLGCVAERSGLATVDAAAMDGGAPRRNGGCGGDYMEGPLDEVRLEAVARSEIWIAAEYRSMTDDYVDYGPSETIR